MDPARDPVYQDNVKPFTWICAVILPSVRKFNTNLRNCKLLSYSLFWDVTGIRDWHAIQLTYSRRNGVE